MEYIPRGELFTAWTACDCFGETLVRLYITEIAMVLGNNTTSNLEVKTHVDLWLIHCNIPVQFLEIKCTSCLKFLLIFLFHSRFPSQVGNNLQGSEGNICFQQNSKMFDHCDISSM